MRACPPPVVLPSWLPYWALRRFLSSAEGSQNVHDVLAGDPNGATRWPAPPGIGREAGDVGERAEHPARIVARMTEKTTHTETHDDDNGTTTTHTETVTEEEHSEETHVS